MSRRGARTILCFGVGERCAAGEGHFDPKPDVKVWMRWKLKDGSWAKWREENPEEVALLRDQLKASQTRPDGHGEVSKAAQPLQTTEPKSSENPHDH